MQDEIYMARCLELAALGEGNVAPNPMVGCVIVEDGKIISEGFHRKYGGHHAEVNAIRAVSDPNRFKNCSIYVNLEPCSHFGKTPPCADLIVSSGFKRVVIANTDPFPEVNGRGIKRLRQAGIEVVTGVLEDEGLKLNRRFFKQQASNKPYVILKWAQSADGFMDPERKAGEQGSLAVSSPSTAKLVHLWRSQEAAILIGAGTVRVDNPSLTVRHIPGKNPTRIVLNDSEALDSSSRVFNAEAPTLLFSMNSQSGIPNYEILEKGENTLSILNRISAHGIQSVLVEGGKFTLETFIKENTWDEIRVITSPKHFGKGLKSPEIGLIPDSSEHYGPDRIDYYFRKS